MASIKLKFRPSTLPEKEGRLYYQVIHNRVVRQIHTAYRICSSEWDADHSSICHLYSQKFDETIKL